MDGNQHTNEEIRIHDLNGRSSTSASNPAALALEEEGRALIEMMIEGTASEEELQAAQDALAEKMARSGTVELNISVGEDFLDENGNIKNFEGFEREDIVFETIEEDDDSEEADDSDAADSTGQRDEFLIESAEVDFDEVGESIANAGMELVDLVGDWHDEWVRGYVDEPVVPMWACIMLQAEEQLSQLADRLVAAECTPGMTLFCLMVAKVQIAEHFITEAMKAPDFPEDAVTQSNRALFYVREAEERLGIT